VDFLPHTEEDVRSMLRTIGVERLDDLFEPIPEAYRVRGDLDIPRSLSEIELLDHGIRLADANAGAARLTCFAGGGAYDHHVPAAVSALARRAEFATSYTPYQPELSQGVLQALYEFQTAVCELFALEVANASLYDGASALVEGVSLAVRASRRRRVLVSEGVHPHYRGVLNTYTRGLEVDVETVGLDERGATRWDAVDPGGTAALVVAYPNFLGVLEDVGMMADRAHDAGALAVAVADPTAMGVLRAPGEAGADVAVGEGQGLGNGLSYGGPYVGLFATTAAFVRQVPGRISGETLDADGRRAFVLTLQAREQHIRRARATSNVCTNQTLMAIAALVHLCWLGPEGLARVGELCIRRTAHAVRRLSEIPGCSVRFDGPRFKELVLQTPVPGDRLVSALARRGVLAGPALGRWWPDLDDALLVACTEKRSAEDVEELAEAIEKELAEL
jgi:glycine dehydrogenase subunit 1